MQELQVQSLGQDDLLEVKMATHPNIFVRIIPWREEPDGLQSMGLPRMNMTKHSKINCQDSSPAILSAVHIGSNKIPSFQSWGIRGWVT